MSVLFTEPNHPREQHKMMSELENAWNEKWSLQLQKAIQEFRDLLLSEGSSEDELEAQMSFIQLISHFVSPPS